MSRKVKKSIAEEQLHYYDPHGGISKQKKRKKCVFLNFIFPFSKIRKVECTLVVKKQNQLSPYFTSSYQKKKKNVCLRKCFVQVTGSIICNGCSLHVVHLALEQFHSGSTTRLYGAHEKMSCPHHLTDALHKGRRRKKKKRERERVTDAKSVSVSSHPPREITCMAACSVSLCRGVSPVSSSSLLLLLSSVSFRSLRRGRATSMAFPTEACVRLYRMR